MKNKKIITAVLCMLLCTAFLTGCGRSLIITTGFGRGDILRVGSEGCKINEVRVYMLDLQKENERLFGNAIWESEDRDQLQETVREQALSQITRVKVLNQMAVERNVMLTDLEQREAEEAEHNYYAGLSAAENKYIDLDEKNLQRMFREYALADKTWTSLGDTAVQTYEEYYKKTQCDLNTRYWQTIKLKKIEGDLNAPGFVACYEAVFAQGLQDSSQGATQDAAAEEGTEASDTTTEAVPAEATPAETTPAEAAPAETTPAETTPAEAAPAEAAPAETAPAETTPAETTPAETTPAETDAAEGTADTAAR